MLPVGVTLLDPDGVGTLWADADLAWAPMSELTAGNCGVFPDPLLPRGAASAAPGKSAFGRRPVANTEPSPVAWPAALPGAPLGPVPVGVGLACSNSRSLSRTEGPPADCGVSMLDWILLTISALEALSLLSPDGVKPRRLPDGVPSGRLPNGALEAGVPLACDADVQRGFCLHAAGRSSAATA